MNLITINDLEKSFGNKMLFKKINLSIHEDERIGLIGRNGEGKTTLLKIIAGLEPKDSGSIMKRNNLRIEYLPQNVNFSKNSTILEHIFKGDSKNIRLLRKYEEEIAKDFPDNNKIVDLTEKMDKNNAWEVESEAKSILTKLGINDFSRKIGELSGGQRRRVALASSLISDVDLLILDEPTNHLDNKTIEWLEEYLINRSGALLMVTHDRYFLDRITNRIIELDNKNIYSYEGNYNYYIRKKAEREDMELASERKRLSLYKKELKWMKQGIRARGTRQKDRVERFEKLKDNKLNMDNIELDITVSGHRLGKKIIEIENISKSYDNHKVIDNFSYTLIRNDRIGILGDNGAGKSTLVDMISGKLKPDEGNIDIGQTVKIGYFSQESENMDDGLRAIEYIRNGGEFIETDDGSKITAAQMMERFLFIGEEQYKYIEDLSGGEKRRLYLLRVLMEGPNVLILDEPTNDLDIGTLTILEEYLEDFIGPVIVVSHDRYFLDKVVDKVLNIENSVVKEYPGNYSYFKENIEEIKLEKEILNTDKKSKPFNREEYKKNRELKFSYNEQREWDTIEKEIKELEKKIERIDILMIKNASEYSKLEEFMDDRKRIEKKLDEKMERWIYLSELKEKIDNQ